MILTMTRKTMRNGKRNAFRGGACNCSSSSMNKEALTSTVKVVCVDEWLITDRVLRGFDFISRMVFNLSMRSCKSLGETPCCSNNFVHGKQLRVGTTTPCW